VAGAKAHHYLVVCGTTKSRAPGVSTFRVASISGCYLF
jgi:hypothetical protein